MVQKHAASRLHYDFRLEHAGVLLSWAVPKGPSVRPADKRLAVHVEDHPVDYFDFEGTIPKGEYGGGTVMVWDWGGVRWLPPHGAPTGAPVGPDDVDDMIERGDLKFELFGRKIRGAYAIVGGRSGKDWLLIKKRDHGARDDHDVTEEDRSVLSGRSMEEIAAAGERVWHSNQPAGGQGGHTTGFIDLSKGRKASFPSAVEPMLATASAKPFDDPGWSYEIKLDGFRTLALVRNGKVKLLSRRGLDATRQYPELQELALLTRGREAVLDGEVVALDEEGTMSFGRLQERTGWKGGRAGHEPHPSIPIVYYVFDLLHDDGYSLVDVPLVERRKLLTARLLDGPHTRLLDSYGGTDGKLLYQAVKSQGGEGVVAKKLGSRYQPAKRSKDWLKIKANREQACAVVGFTPPQGGRKHLGSLAVGVIDGGHMAYAGQVGSGFNEALLRELESVLRKAALKGPPNGMANLEMAPREITWVKPQLVCEVKYNEWTRDGVLRQPTFLRVQPDMAVEDCVKDPG
ncbi:MAG: bifunctional non-ous end joining protein LigD [Chloroflexota bacterium]|nr:bifunctional non-ous end joining protein LigD [Chloroflexota bacterium]